MQVVARIIIILLVVFLVWLLRRWIKRLIFILILLALAFLIYGIFNPSGAAKLWYNVRTFPQRVASWMGSSEKFLDYDSYKLGVSSVGDKIGDEIGDEIGLSDDENEDNLELDDVELSDVREEGKLENDTVNEIEELDEDVSQDKDKRAIKAFPRSIKFVNFSQLIEKKVGEVDGPLAGYSKSDLLLVISKYIEENLDDDTDILVTVEYGNDGEKPQRVILETRQRTLGERQTIYFSSKLLGNDSVELQGKNEEGDKSSKVIVEQKDNTKYVQKRRSNNLTQKEQQEAEEIFSVLF